MRIKDFFTVPTNEKVTERHLYRVLVSSVCSILLCMSCLAGTTWAWFTVSIENAGNVIEIGTPEVKLSVDGNKFSSGSTIPAEAKKEYPVVIEHANRPDDFQKKSDLYVTLTINGETIGCLTLHEENQYSDVIIISSETDKEITLNWVVSWFMPANATELAVNTITVTEPIADETESLTELPSASTEPVIETTAPLETVIEPAETTTAPAEETTAPTNTTEPEPPTTDVLAEETTVPVEPA